MVIQNPEEGDGGWAGKETLMRRKFSQRGISLISPVGSLPLTPLRGLCKTGRGSSEVQAPSTLNIYADCSA